VELCDKAVNDIKSKHALNIGYDAFNKSKCNKILYQINIR
jgi:hypothetical protein